MAGIRFAGMPMTKAIGTWLFYGVRLLAFSIFCDPAFCSLIVVDNLYHQLCDKCFFIELSRIRFSDFTDIRATLSKYRSAKAACYVL